MRGAPFGLRPYKVRKLWAIRVTFNRNVTTHGSFRANHQLTSYHFYPVAERVKTSAFRWRNAARSSRNSQHGIRLHQNLKSVRKESKIPLVEVLKVLRKLSQKFSKQGLGQSPKVFFCHFYPVAERRQGNKLPPSKSRWTGFGS